ncbi:protein bunched, class 2/F/G isoform-like isoform X2 [Uloborus diversus]|uniref:protein bunched, class 2/F/G isoform-like isoform X2 n=1 Tax=Uloborus diversus TaxID=327109 RepID=UPI0024098A74|nr:protein bunched, class 2/F/G isoform-like isoform X2 [Uloborus diversus]
MNLLFLCLILWYFLRHCPAMMSENNNRNTGNFNESPPYVVGILSPSTTVYIDQVPANGRDVSPPNDLNLRRRNNNSFQITSVTVQGSRKNDDFADDSADDLDETSHTDDLSSDFLDSSRADNEGYHSEDIAEDLCSPCGPIIFATQLPASNHPPNMNLGMVGVTPTFAAIGPVAGGVTMMTSKSESPISAQVPIMNPLPDNWQRRFKVVKIVSSEPFRRGRWLCMDFKDPPSQSDIRESASNGTNTPPTIQITNCDAEEMQPVEQLLSGSFAQVYEIPINQTFNGNFVMANQQQMYGIILPQSDNLQPVTLVQDMSLQTALPFDTNFNNLVNAQNNNILVQQDALVHESIQNFNKPVATLVNSSSIPNQSPPSSQCANNNNNYINSSPQTVLNHVNSQDPMDSIVPLSRSRTNSESNRLLNHFPPARFDKVDTENSESAASTGANTVAIDNKIEQAMDLVKSHLMFAVREEVEVLKEKITELLERISQLEHENDILRANASAETLKQLSNQKKNTAGGTGKPQVAAAPPSN